MRRRRYTDTVLDTFVSCAHARACTRTHAPGVLRTRNGKRHFAAHHRVFVRCDQFDKTRHDKYLASDSHVSVECVRAHTRARARAMGTGNSKAGDALSPTGATQDEDTRPRRRRMDRSVQTYAPLELGLLGTADCVRVRWWGDSAWLEIANGDDVHRFFAAQMEGFDEALFGGPYTVLRSLKQPAFRGDPSRRGDALAAFAAYCDGESISFADFEELFDARVFVVPSSHVERVRDELEYPLDFGGSRWVVKNGVRRPYCQ